MKAYMSADPNPNEWHSQDEWATMAEQEARRILAVTEPHGCYVPLDWLPQHGIEEARSLADVLRAFVEE